MRRRARIAAVTSREAITSTGEPFRPEGGRRRAPWIAQSLRIRPSTHGSVDPVWTKIREAAPSSGGGRAGAGRHAACHHPQPAALRERAQLPPCAPVGTTEVPAALIRQIFDEALTDDPAIGYAARADIVAVADRDPACTSHLDPLLWFKGYQALQTYRVAHWLWVRGRERPRALPAEPRQRAVRPRHPSRRADRQEHLHRPRHRRGDRRDRGRRGRRLHAARRDPGRHRQGARRPPSQGAAAACCWARAPRSWATSRSAPAPRSPPAAWCSKPVPAGCTAAGVPARIIGCVDVPEPALEMDRRESRGKVPRCARDDNSVEMTAVR